VHYVIYDRIHYYMYSNFPIIVVSCKKITNNSKQAKIIEQQKHCDYFIKRIYYNYNIVYVV